MADVVVELYGHPVGRLRGTDWRAFDLEVDAFRGLSHDIQTFIGNLRAGREAEVPVSGGSPA